jgi:hypothetical protein
MLAEWGVYLVAVADKPSHTDRTQKVAKDAAPTGSGSSWAIEWTVSDKTSEEVQEYDARVAEANRAKRNTLLAKTDYFALTDVTMDAPMTTYRQSLRDLPSHANWPNLDEADWPTKP